jgi:hypothetical protein
MGKKNFMLFYVKVKKNRPTSASELFKIIKNEYSFCFSALFFK